MTDLILAPGMTVLIRAFDEVPAHHFEIEAVFDDCVTGYAITGPLAGEYGEPEIELIAEIISAP